MLTNFRDKTLSLVKHRSRMLTYDIIARDTGITKDWLKKFVRGEFPNPGVNRIETLYTYLSGKQLDIS